MNRTIVFFLTLAAAGALSVSAADVKENWEKNCAKCHGADGAGKTKMGEKLKVKDYTDAKVQADLKDDHMAKAIKEGVKEGESVKMKAFGDALSDDEIKELVKHVRSFKKSPSVSATVRHGTVQFRGGLLFGGGETGGFNTGWKTRQARSPPQPKPLAPSRAPAARPVPATPPPKCPACGKAMTLLGEVPRGPPPPDTS